MNFDNFKNFMPSRFVVAFVIVPVLAIIIFLFLKEKAYSPALKKEVAKSSFVKTLEEEVRYRDSDSDGLKDWEERLHGTEEDNPDTDGDGILDGLEIKGGTDPLDPLNKKDESNFVKDIKIEEYYKNDVNLSKTDILARNFFIKTIILKESDLLGNDNAQNQVIKELLLENQVVFKDKYKKEDLNILKYVSDLKVKESIKNGVQRYSIGKLRDNYYLFSMYMDGGGDSYLRELSDNVDLTEDFLDFLVKVKINESIALLYLEYLNILDKYNTAVKYLVLINEDPVAAWSAFEQYEALEERLRYVTEALGLYFSEKNI